MRIVSLLPSATEMVCLLGLEEQLVGVTHECDFPPSVTALPKVTRSLIPAEATSAQIDALVSQRAHQRLPLYQLDLPTLLEVRPDLIVTQALCDVCAMDETEVVEASRSMPWRPRVLNLAPMSLDGVFDAITDLAAAANVPVAGGQVVESLRRRVDAVADRTVGIEQRPSVLFLEWLDPPFCGGHWNPELVELAGGRECIGRPGERSRRIGFEQILEQDPELLFIACCGFGIERARIDLEPLKSRPGWASLRAVRNDRVVVADGSTYFNRPGPRLVDSLEMLARAIHPQVFAEVAASIGPR